MDTNIKNAVGITLVLTMLIFAYAAVNAAKSFSKMIQLSSFRSFNVSAEGKIVAVPDVAQFTFSVITEGGKNIASLQKDNTQKINDAIKFVKSQGVEAKDIKTQSYNLSPRYQYSSCKVGSVCSPAEIVGYTITQTISVKVRDFEKIGDLMSGVTQNGANSVADFSFTIDDPTEVQNQARAQAIAKAKEKAQAVAKAGGFKLGRLLSIEEANTGMPAYSNYELMRSDIGMGGGGSLTPTIEPGSKDITVDVTLKYEIE